MQDVKTKINELYEKFGKLYKSLNLEEKKTRLNDLDSQSLNPDLWSDPQKAKGIMQSLSDLKKEIEDINSLKGNIETLKELSDAGALSPEMDKDIAKAQKDLDKLTLSSFLSGPYDAKNAIVSIHAGQGGTEAMDWTGMLLRMYLRYCERKGWATAVMDSTAGEEAGIKSVTFSVSGNYAYGYLKNEAGTHRLVRQSPFNADKLRQTSFALVEVLPEFEDVDLPDIEIKDEDIELQFFHSSSQGGQNVQKVSTAVRIIHKPTGIVVTAQAERFQEQNRNNAMNLLKSKLWALEQQKAIDTKKEIRGVYKPASWGNQIRSYVLHPYKMIKDLRTQMETGNTENFLDGDIDAFIESELQTL